MKNGFQAIYFEYIGILDSYFIHRYVIINKGQVRLRIKSTNYLLSEVWPLISLRKMVSGRYLLKNIDILDSYFIHRYIYMVIKYRVSINDKIHRLFSESYPLISYKNGFRVISFEYIGILDSYFIHRYIIIKYRSILIKDIIHLLFSELWPLISARKMFSGRYLLNT